MSGRMIFGAKKLGKGSNKCSHWEAGGIDSAPGYRSHRKDEGCGMQCQCDIKIAMSSALSWGKGRNTGSTGRLGTWIEFLDYRSHPTAEACAYQGGPCSGFRMRESGGAESH